MGKVVQFPTAIEATEAAQQVTTDEYFGGCPHCGETDGYLNVGREHWFVCDAHKTKWHVGSNLFSSWHDETEEGWLKNEYRLSQFMEVEPIYPELTEEERERAAKAKYERAVVSALGAVGWGYHPIDPDDIFGFADSHKETTPQLNRLCILTKDGIAYDLDRTEAYAAYEAHIAGDKAAIPRLLQGAV